MGDEKSPGGIDLLAAMVGIPAARMREDPKTLGRGLLALRGEAMSLLRGYASDDPAVRVAAEHRWAELNALLPPTDGPDRPRPSPRSGLSAADRERLRRGLRKVVAALEEAAGTERTRRDG